MLNSSWEKREGKGKQHFHQITGKVEDGIWDDGKGVEEKEGVNEFRGGVLHL